MADMAQAFRNNRHLQQFVLTDVTPTAKILGTGSYGSVEEVKYQDLICAGKKIHEALIDAGNQGVPELVQKYEQECQLMSSLCHPNITQFLGLCFLPGTQLPLLVMERLETSLDDLLEHMPGLPLSLKRSVLEDVASGLVYLHKRTPSVIHRDLTAKNVLLTSSLVAKITDMGNSRIVDMKPGQMARTLSKLPGTLVYMPPEALGETHRYGPSLDIFSFGHLALYTLIQKYPGDLLQSTFVNPDDTQQIHARSELERRGEYIEILEIRIGMEHPALVQLVKECLHNAPVERPATDEVLDRLQRMKVEMKGEYGENVTKLDYGRLQLTEKMKMKMEVLKYKEVIVEVESKLSEAEKKATSLEQHLNDQTNKFLSEREELQSRVHDLERELLTKDLSENSMKSRSRAFGPKDSPRVQKPYRHSQFASRSFRRQGTSLLAVEVPGFLMRGRGWGAWPIYELRMNLLGEKWSVYKSYAQFKAFYEDISKKYPQLTVITFPPSKWFGATNQEFIEKRRVLLETFMQSLIAVSSTLPTCPIYTIKSHRLTKEKLYSFSSFFDKGQRINLS